MNGLRQEGWYFVRFADETSFAIKVSRIGSHWVQTPYPYVGADLPNGAGQELTVAEWRRLRPATPAPPARSEDSP